MAMKKEDPMKRERVALFCVAALVLALLFCTSARAGTVTVKWNEAPDRDLARCRITVQNATGAAINTVEVPALNSDVIHETKIDYDSRALQGVAGKVVGWCIDAAGQTSVDSAALPVTFPDIKPGSPKLIDVQVVP
jgi:hypothetical protein